MSLSFALGGDVLLVVQGRQAEAGQPAPAAAAAPPRREAGRVRSGGGELSDPISAPFFPRTAGGYCVDPQGEIKTYGEKGKLSMDEVCTTAFDGECEVYKRFGLKRVVSLHYVDGSGKGGTVEVNLSQFGDVAGAYGMFTLRVVAGDPAEPSTPKPLAAGAAGAIGTGRAYVWRGQHLAELQYVNEQESPEQLAKSSEAILTTVGKEIGPEAPGRDDASARRAAPSRRRIASRTGSSSIRRTSSAGTASGPGAVGFYKDGDRRWRVLAIVKDDADQAKDAFKTIKSKPGTLPDREHGRRGRARRRAREAGDGQGAARRRSRCSSCERATSSGASATRSTCSARQRARIARRRASRRTRRSRR